MNRSTLLPLLLAMTLLPACRGNSPAVDGDGGVDSGTDEDTDTWPEYPATGVDILLVVDNWEMHESQLRSLRTHIMTLVNALLDPPPGWPAAEQLESVRVAAVTGDMGLQWGGNPYEDVDGWPTENLPINCDSVGDNGAFRVYQPDDQVWIRDGAVPCSAAAGQCPAGWTCEEIGDDGVGACAAPLGEEAVDCPDLQPGPHAETPLAAEEPNPGFATQAACLADVGYGGCGIQQQLQAGAVALTTGGQQQFVRDDALLVVIVTTTYDDCSILDSDLFYTDEIQNLADGRLFLACDSHPELLYPIAHFRDVLLDLKGGNPNGVVFAAIAGVPIDPACQGTGDAIGACLNHADMQLEVVPWGESSWFWDFACAQYEGDSPVSWGVPGIRYVELAQQLGPNGYLSSICNDDWAPAMRDIATIVAAELSDG